MPATVSDAKAPFREVFRVYKTLTEALGPEKAWEKMLEEYPERIKQSIGPYIEEATLAEGFTAASPTLKRIGMDMNFTDISQHGSDAVLEVQRYCPYLEVCKEFGFETPCRAVCEMHIEAIERAYPLIKGKILARQAEGDCVCIFKYERPQK